MGENSKIQWTNHTFNPWIGCTKVSEGCAHCYAENSTRARVLRSRGQETWGRGKSRSLTTDANWKEPLKWNKAAGLRHHEAAVIRAAGIESSRLAELEKRPRVFCASLADWLDDEVPIEWLGRLLALIYLTPNLDWQLLTKRPQNFQERIEAAAARLSANECEDLGSWAIDWMNGHAPSNVWLGATVENQARADERIPLLMSIPAKVRFLSCEPLLGPVDLTEITRQMKVGQHCFDALQCDVAVEDDEWHGRSIDWVICGGESGGPKSRPMHPDWARSLRNQCAAAGVPFFFKQWGEWSEVDGAARTPGGNHISIDADSKTGKSLYRPLTDCLVSADGKTFSRESLQPGIEARLMRRAHKAISGRLLDGIEWNEFPKLAEAHALAALMERRAA